MSEYFDDNYGRWHDMDDPETQDFYRRTQRTNVAKRCKRCDRMVNIQPHYAICGSCADAVERGMDY
jgi:hypothetical protein